MKKLIATDDVVFDEHIPYYLQVKSIIEEKIESKELKPGHQLPSEAEICEEFGVSRTVVRQALHELELTGLLIKKKGKGSFVSEPKIMESFVQTLSGFHQDMEAQRRPTHSKILQNGLIKATAHVASKLGLRVGSKVILLKRLRFVDKDPIQLVASYIPYRLCSEILKTDFADASLYSFMEEKGIFLTRGYRTIEAVSASASEAKLMNIETGAPMIRIESIGYTENGSPVEYYEAVHRGDRTRFGVELIRERHQEEKSGPGGIHRLFAERSGIEVLPPRSKARKSTKKISAAGKK